MPKSFPKIKAKMSVNTDISNAVKKKLLLDEFAIGKIRDRLTRIIRKIIHTKMLLCAFILNNSNKEYPNIPNKIILKKKSLEKKTKKSTKRPKINPVITLFIYPVSTPNFLFLLEKSMRARSKSFLLKSGQSFSEK